MNFNATGYHSTQTKFDFRKLSQEWYEHGARIIGGCCSTGIKEVGQIATFYKTISSQKSKQKENLNLNNDLMKFRSSNI